MLLPHLDIFALHFFGPVFGVVTGFVATGVVVNLAAVVGGFVEVLFLLVVEEVVVLV